MSHQNSFSIAGTFYVAEEGIHDTSSYPHSVAHTWSDQNHFQLHYPRNHKPYIQLEI